VGRVSPIPIRWDDAWGPRTILDMTVKNKFPASVPAPGTLFIYHHQCGPPKTSEKHRKVQGEQRNILMKNLPRKIKNDNCLLVKLLIHKRKKCFTSA
jgi:hypothetical protein